MRTFEDLAAVRTAVPLLVGLSGPSGGGKTFSALRLATGIQRVTGGDIYVIDTEARRALHYADDFRFRHLAFEAPFGPLDYLAAIRHCAAKGAKIIVVDSMSHEHDGAGGVLEMHTAECDRLAKEWKTSVDKVKMSGWAKPKQERRQMISAILQLPINWIFCFRAKEKIKVKGGGKPEPQGFMPIAGEEFIFEMTMTALLLPGANGVPTWQSNEIGEKLMIKLPRQFRDLMLGQKGPLDESVGQQLAEWAAGAPQAAPPDVDTLIVRYQAGEDVRADVKAAWRRLSKTDRDRWTAAVEASKPAAPAVPAVDEPPEPGSDG